MADGYKIWQICPSCSGTGKNIRWDGDEHGVGGLIEDNCSRCLGEKYIFLGWCSVNTSILPDGTELTQTVFPTYKIVEATVTSEYSALSTANKTAYGMIISLGTVDLSDGTATKDKLWDMFGAETTTRANLETLVA